MAKETKQSEQDTLNQALETMTRMQEQMDSDRAAFKAELDAFREENKELKREATKTVQDSVDALAAMRNKIDHANQKMFDNRMAESKERCKHPLSRDEREQWRELERRATTSGFEEQPSPAEMTMLGEYRIRAKIGG